MLPRILRPLADLDSSLIQKLWSDVEDWFRVDEQKEDSKRTAAGIPTWSPTVVLICRSTAYVWQSGRDAQFSADCGRTWKNCLHLHIDTRAFAPNSTEQDSQRMDLLQIGDPPLDSDF
jgi:hypothetical protein